MKQETRINEWIESLEKDFYCGKPIDSKKESIESIFLTKQEMIGKTVIPEGFVHLRVKILYSSYKNYRENFCGEDKQDIGSLSEFRPHLEIKDFYPGYTFKGETLSYYIKTGISRELF